jgi:hypothetical protein
METAVSITAVSLAPVKMTIQRQMLDLRNSLNYVYNMSGFVPRSVPRIKTTREAV